MKFNPSKCLHVVITKKRSYIQNNYRIYWQQIHQVTSAGITIDQHLTWKDHINNICHKANSVKGFLRQNLHQCPNPTAIKYLLDQL